MAVNGAKKPIMKNGCLRCGRRCGTAAQQHSSYGKFRIRLLAMLGTRLVMLAFRILRRSSMRLESTVSEQSASGSMVSSRVCVSV